MGRLGMGVVVLTTLAACGTTEDLKDELDACYDDLDSSDADLAECGADLMEAESDVDLEACLDDLQTAGADLVECESDLADYSSFNRANCLDVCEDFYYEYAEALDIPNGEQDASDCSLIADDVADVHDNIDDAISTAALCASFGGFLVGVQL
jgi:hypothetical protein